MKSLPDWLSHRAVVSPDRLALVAGGARWSYAELDARATVAARRLQELGVQPGDRAALLLRNGPEFATVVHAAPRAGVVIVPLNTRLALSELVWQIADSGARLLVFDDAHAAVAGALQADVGIEGWRASLTHCPLPTAYCPLGIDLSALHTIVYTSGTTGRPKGAMLTYGNHWWSAVGSALNLGMHADDRWLAVLPLFHVGGLAILLRGAIYGITAVIHERFEPGEVNRAIDEDGVTIVSAVSTMLARMLEARGGRPYPPTLRCVLLGGGPAPRPLLEECARRRVPVVQTYGLTETASQIATLAPSDALRKLGSAGKPLYPNRLRIDRAGSAAEPGEAGEILVAGPSVTVGYVNRPEETANALAGGWLHTGDVGYLDDEGYLYVLDRRADLIVSGGENVYPAEIEAILLAHPAVEEAGVVGVPDERWGQVPVAVVRLRTGASVAEPELAAFCAERLARYKVPTRVRFAGALPRNAAGKLLRSALRDQVRTSPPQSPSPPSGEGD